MRRSRPPRPAASPRRSRRRRGRPPRGSTARPMLSTRVFCTGRPRRTIPPEPARRFERAARLDRPMSCLTVRSWAVAATAAAPVTEDVRIVSLALAPLVPSDGASAAQHASRRPAARLPRRPASIGQPLLRPATIKRDAVELRDLRSSRRRGRRASTRRATQRCIRPPLVNGRGRPAAVRPPEPDHALRMLLPPPHRRRHERDQPPSGDAQPHAGAACRPAAPPWAPSLPRAYAGQIQPSPRAQRTS